MDSQVGRRGLLQVGGLITGTIAGCGYLNGDGPRYTTVQVSNMAMDRRAVDISVLDPDGGERSDATWFAESIHFEARDDEDDVEYRDFEQAFEMDRAIVEVRSGAYGPHAQFTYYPYCSDRDDILQIGISREGEILWDVACDGRND